MFMHAQGVRHRTCLVVLVKARWRMNPEHKTILLVDDESDFVEGARTVLEAAGYEVISAADGAEARQALQDRPVDLAVLDVNLPDDDGFHLCRELRERSEETDLPVLFLSVRKDFRDILFGMASGARDFLSKPIGRLELLRAVERTLAA